MKRLLIVITVLLITFEGKAQLSVGIKSGINFSTIVQNYEDEDQELPSKARAGFVGGVVFDIKITDNFYIRPELLSSNKGVILSIEDYGDDYKAIYSLDYIEMPINFIYHIEGFELFAGPYVAIAINGDSFYGTGPDSDDYYNIQLQDEVTVYPFGPSPSSYDRYVSKTDAGFQIGMGVSIGNFVLNGYLSKGLLNLIPEINVQGGDYIRPKDRQTNRTISFSLSYIINRMSDGKK